MYFYQNSLRMLPKNKQITRKPYMSDYKL